MGSATRIKNPASWPKWIGPKEFTLKGDFYWETMLGNEQYQIYARQYPDYKKLDKEWEFGDFCACYDFFLMLWVERSATGPLRKRSYWLQITWKHEVTGEDECRAALDDLKTRLESYVTLNVL